jgi:mannose-1-phosphate guanylyltransferase/mannose-6-phosphate isomerase
MKNDHIYAVILAGGFGTRFWPASRQDKPKQFLQIVQNRTLLELTVARIKPLVAPKNIFIVTNRRYKKETAAQLSKFKIPSGNIMLEPSGKNTAPAICWAAARIHRRDARAVTLCLPSDHMIVHEARFLRCVRLAITAARRGFLVTFGIVPTRPETGYGYLRTAKMKGLSAGVVRVVTFTEKPSRPAAQRFVKSGRYFWNSGMFVWTTETILQEMQKHLPQVARLIVRDPSPASIGRQWPKLPKISIDYGVLERSDRVVAVVSDGLGWSDLGSWESLWETLKKDKNGNVHLGRVKAVGSRGCLVYAHRRQVALIGLNDCIVADTDDCLLVCKRQDSQKVKEIVETLIKEGSKLI